ncbi:MAG: chromosome segregation protein SMC [Nitrospiraceae bacterium]|nr:chromosome segregation protein SMC [Nitrospiraceae bacterium]
MRIDKIELIGFKSFADKTTFVLHPGITCIVGPNGCGKSNIVDAFRWVLGEQSAKSLRGEKMEEVIFNGSIQKKPKGMAEVTMIATGLNGGSNGQGQDQVAISRRLYRSGESEYMINRTPCRLKDIKDIFLDTGLDFRSYSILEQGRIGEILNSKPLERRFIIEEVAGVMKYKIRKAEALSKLESSRVNLVRINDIILEVKKQINILDRLAKKAERYQKLSQEMHAIELKLARREYQQISDSLDSILEEYGSLKEKEAVITAEVSDIENRTESRRIALLEREKALELIQNNFQSLEREISEIERGIAVGRNDIDNLGEYRSKLQVQAVEMDTRSSELAGRCEELRLNGERLSAEIESHAAILREKTEQFRSVEEELAEKEERVEDQRREIFRITEGISGHRNDLGRQQTAFESLERREASAIRESDEARKALTGVETSISSVESGIHDSNNEALLLKEKKEVILRELSGSKAKLDSLMRSLSDTREDLASTTSRLDSLREIVLDSPSADAITAQSGVKLLASLSDVVEVDPAYEKAVEAALSEKADSFILGSIDELEKAVASLKAAGAVRTAFITVAPPASHNPPQAPGGVIGRALDFVRAREDFAQVVENLLGSVLIVRDIHAAFSLMAPDASYTYVTPDGDVIEPSGAVVAGEGRGIFKRKREIRELEESIDGKRSRIDLLNGEIQAIQTGIAERETGVRDVESSIHNIEKEISLSKLTVDNYVEDKERINRKLSYLTLELEEIVREKIALADLIKGIGENVQAAEAKKAAAEAEAQLLQEGISLKKSEIESYRAEVTDLRLVTASNRERMEAIRNEIDSSVRTLDDLRQKKTELIAETESVLQRITQREKEILDQEGRLRKLVAEADTLRQDISLRKEEIDRENADLMTVEHELKSLRHQAGGLASRISELDVAKAEHRMRLENLADHTRTNYGSGIEEVELREIAPEEEERLAELRVKIQEIGPVNLGTLEEYEELRTRYEFMTKQQEDLTRSIAELEEAITKINSTTRKKLRDAFEALNAKFGEVFRNLFGGGKAELVLTDEQNILESGIDIVVQPPGKKLQNINLLSGGEKALTALSVQFASFLIKPTPLCILDEADAPLDESNTERYARMLNELSMETQFIVVTHNRTTMSVAQHLYGITMEEAGVSKVISMQLEEIQA